ERAGVRSLLEVRAVLAVLRGDLFARLRVLADDARQVEQAQRRVDVDGGEVHGLEDGCGARLGRGRFLGGFLLRRRRIRHFAGCRVDDLGRTFDALGGRLRVDLGDVGAEAAVFGDDVLAVL